jgi:hypothetical protein
MARTAAKLTEGLRLSDLLSIGVLGKAFPIGDIKAALQETGKASVRERMLPAHVVVYYVICLSMFMQVSCQEVLRCVLEGLHWLGHDGARSRVACDAAISQARRRIGAEPLRRLCQTLVSPIATEQTKGARYRRWRLVSLDGSTLDLADTEVNVKAFGKPPSRSGTSAFPQLRFVSLIENGTHVFFGMRPGPLRTSEHTLAREVVCQLCSGMLCLADRGFFGYELWRLAADTEADLLWRVQKKIRLPVIKRLSDGSFLSKIYPNETARNNDRDAIVVRVVEYKLKDISGTEPLYRLITTILDPDAAPASELAALYHERWEIESGLDEIKTHLRGNKIVLRSKTPDLVEQEFFGLMMAHYAIRGLMHEAALKAKVDSDSLSFVHAVRVVRRKLPQAIAFFPSGNEAVP